MRRDDPHGLGAPSVGHGEHATLDQGDAQPAFFAVLHPIVYKVEAMDIFEGPGGELERHAMLPVVLVRFGLVPFEDQSRFHIVMVRQCRMCVE